MWKMEINVQRRGDIFFHFMVTLPKNIFIEKNTYNFFQRIALKEKRMLLKKEKLAQKLESNNNNSDEDCKRHGNWKLLSKEEVIFFFKLKIIFL
jgi:hypothetical protein